MNPENFFSTEGKRLIEQAISEAEKKSSAEIRVHVEDSCKVQVLDRAATVFAKLGMQKTKLRNGVLIYLCISSKQFAILGDAGINHLVPADFWDNTRKLMEEHFKEGRFAEGIVIGIRMAGQKLETHFPCCAEDVNELPNEISYAPFND